MTVTTSAGTSAIVPADQFIYGGVPTINALESPVVGVNGGTGPANLTEVVYEIDIVGANLAGATEVDFGADKVTSFLVDTATLIVLVVPDEAPGTVHVAVVTLGGTSADTAADHYTFIPGPFVLQVDSGGEGPLTGGTSVEIRGFHLGDATAVNFGNTVVPVNSSNYTSGLISGDLDEYGYLTVASPPASVAGAVILTVTSPEGTSSGEYFVYLPIPTITGISPASGALAGGNAVVITGTGLYDITGVDFGGVAVSSSNIGYADGTTLSVVSPAGVSLGTVDVTLAAVGAASAISPADQFTYMPPPVLTGLSLSSGALEGGTPVVITGIGLANATEVDFRDAGTGYTSTAAILGNTDTQVLVTSPQSPTGDVGPVDVTVITPDGTTAITEPADEFTYTLAPYITQVALVANGQYPATGPEEGGSLLTIDGDDLIGATAVYFGNTPAASFTDNGDETLTAVSPAGTPGTVDVTVTTSVGTSDVSPPDQFTYVVAPGISSISPTLGSSNGGTTITITGTDLANATEVDFGGIAATGFTVNMDGSITATSPNSGSPGTVDVTVVTASATSAISPADQFTYEGPPSISTQDKTSGSVAGGTLVTITGTSLSNATVNFGSNPATILNDTDSRLLVLSPEATGDSPGMVDVIVTTAYGSTSETDGFNYALPPAVTAISQTSGPAAGGTSVTIHGTNLLGASAVDFGGVPANFVDNGDGTLSADSPSGSVSTVDVTVVTLGGTTATSPADQFTYLAVPSVSGISPAAGPMGGGTHITITGTGLANATEVEFGGDDYGDQGVYGMILSNTDGQIVATVPAYFGETTTDVQVETAGGTSLSASADFTYVAAPSVSGLSISSGNRDGNDYVSIYGSNLDGATAVDFGANAATILDESAGQIDVVSPAGAVGPAVDVTVVTPGGVSATSPADEFTYFRAVPAVTGVSPSVGAAAGGETVTITGTDLDNASEVYFGGVESMHVTSDSLTQITATVPAGTLGTVDVTVATSAGTSSISPADQFTGIAAPAVSGLNTLAGPPSGGTDVTVFGTDLDGATSVKFGQTAGTIIVDASTYILAESPAHSAGTVHVTVTTPYGTSTTSTADQFTFVAPPTAVAASYSVTQDATLTVSAANGVLTEDTDPQGLPLTATLLTDPADGILSFNSDGSFTYTPSSGYFGPDSFTYEASNAYVNSSPTTVSITVSPPTLTWVSGQSGTWTEGTWGAGSTYPNNAYNATVSGSGSVVNVNTDQSANALAVQSGGQVVVGPGTVLSITADAGVTGGTLNVNSSGLFSAGGTLTLDGGGSVTGGAIFAAAFQLNDGTVSANFSGPGGVTKDTSGTVVFSGANSYAGGTVVNVGTFIVTHAGALPIGSSLSVGVGASMLFGASQLPNSGAVGLAAPSQGTAAAAGSPTSIVTAGVPASASAVSTHSTFLKDRLKTNPTYRSRRMGPQSRNRDRS